MTTHWLKDVFWLKPWLRQKPPLLPPQCCTWLLGMGTLLGWLVLFSTGVARRDCFIGVVGVGDQRWQDAVFHSILAVGGGYPSINGAPLLSLGLRSAAFRGTASLGRWWRGRSRRARSLATVYAGRCLPWAMVWRIGGGGCYYHRWLFTLASSMDAMLNGEKGLVLYGPPHWASFCIPADGAAARGFVPP